MKTKAYYLFLILFITSYQLYSQILFFVHNNDIISYDMVTKQTTLEWKAPFPIQNVSLNELCQVLTFTKGTKEGRQVGYYLLNEKKYKIIGSKSFNNFAGDASPNGQLIYFNTMVNDKWTISLFDLNTSSITYDIIPLKDDTSFPYCWQNDSVIQIINFSEVLFGNIYNHTTLSYPLGENLSGGLSIPGSKLLFSYDSLAFIKAEDSDNDIAEIDGHPFTKINYRLIT
jgi:hypothetical protein